MGTLSWTLTILAANGALMAGLLWFAGGNRVANRFLAAVVGLISLRLVVYVIGFAGVYDDHPWITFAPLDASLAFGPFLWLYVVTLTRGWLPIGWRLHLVPAAIQIGYSIVAFSLPLEAKLRWFRGPHLEVVEPLGLLVFLLSCATYLTLAWRRQRDYQSWLDERFADRDSWRLGWLTAILIAFAALVAATATATVVNFAVAPLDYFGRTPVVVASSLIAYALGMLGWRHSGLGLPSQTVPCFEDTPTTMRSRSASAFETWSRRIEHEGWWQEEGLTLATVAARLATSERSLSRALNEGAGQNFNEFVNGLRVEAVMRTITGGSQDDLLSIAMDCGFASKASFNRAFLRRTGVTPSSWRAAAQIPPTITVGAT